MPKENPQDEGQDLFETMSDLYNASEDEPERPIDDIEPKEVPDDDIETSETEEVAEADKVETEEVEQAEEVEEVAEEVEELPPLEANALWEQNVKEMFPTLPRELQEFLLNTTTNWQTGYNNKFQELANERKQIEPIKQTFQDPLLSNYINQNGWQPHQAVQIFGQHMKNILTDPKTGYQTLMQSLGHDPTQVFSQEDEMYVDPAVQQANQRIEQLERERLQEQQRKQAEVEEKALQEVADFMNKTNEQGNLVYPRFQELREAMIPIANAMPHLQLEQVYRMAEVQNPAQTQDHVTGSTQAATPQQVKRTQAAKKTVKSKQSTKPTKPEKLSIDDELKAQWRSAGA
ncbi:MAG: hypothetical protein ACPG5L_12485 [Vibrio gallaecicus]